MLDLWPGVLVSGGDVSWDNGATRMTIKFRHTNGKSRNAWT